MAKGTFTREEMRETLKEDEVGEVLKRSTDFLQKHGRTLLALIVLVLVILMTWKVVQYRQLKGVENSNIQLAQAQQSYFQAVYSIGEPPEERSAKLESAIRIAGTLRQSYASTPAARLALYLQGNAYLAKPLHGRATESLDKAKETFRHYADTAKTKEDKARGLLGLATAYQNVGFLQDDAAAYQKAKDTYAEIVKLLPANSYLVLEAKLAHARLAAATGETPTAVRLYNAILEVASRPEAPEERPTLTESERQRRDFEKRVREVLDRHTFETVAREELALLVPPSAERLGLDLPEVSAAQ